MRRVLLTTLLAALPACTMNNPLFGLSSDAAGSSSGAADSTAAPVTTGATDPGQTSGSSAPTMSTGGPGTGVSESDTSALDSTGPGDTTGTSGEPPPVCAPVVSNSLDPHVYINGVLYTECVLEISRAFTGKLDATGGELVLEINEACAPGDEGTSVTLGKGYPLPDKFSGCATATVTWNKVNGDCAIGLLDIRHPMLDTVYYAGSFRHPTPPDFPIKATPMQLTNCGCPGDIPGCCAPLDAGDLTLTPSGGAPIAPQKQAVITLPDDTKLEFHNLQSYVGAMCDWHIDWIAAHL